MLQMTVEEFAKKAISRLCDRCAEGEAVWPPVAQHDTYGHGCHTTRSGVDIPPEPCPAHVVHDLLKEHEEGRARLADALFGPNAITRR